MNTTLQSLKNLYVKLGGTLADTYEDIASGIPVSDYTAIPDATDALGKLEIGGGGLTLYGPYYATSSSSKTIEAVNQLDISLSNVTNHDGDTLSAPSGRYTAFLIGVFGLNNGITDLKLVSFSAPVYESQYMYPASITIGNDGDKDITLYPDSYGVKFYSDVEFTVVS